MTGSTKLFSVSLGYSTVDLVITAVPGINNIAADRSDRIILYHRVVASDISAEQLKQATAVHNVHYEQGQAEHTGLPEASADLITVATALHWYAWLLSNANFCHTLLQAQAKS